MKKLFFISIIFVVSIMLSVSDADAKIVVLSVKGKAAYKTGRSWKPLRKNMTLRKGTKISTGVRSRVKLKIDSHIVRIRPLTMMKIYSYKSSRSRSRTHLGLRRGSIRAKINRRKRVRTNFRISTPVATSSVRGTEEIVTYWPESGMKIDVLKGVIEGLNKLGVKKIIAGRLQFNQGSDSSKPGRVYNIIVKKTSPPIHDRNITREEKYTIELSPVDYINNIEDPMRIIFDKMKTNIVITPIW